MAENGSLSPKQQRAILALLTCKTVGEAAQSAGVGERTLYTWLTLPAFRAALRSAEDDVLDSGTRQLLRIQSKAIDRIESVLDNQTASDLAALKAAQMALDQLIKTREQRDTEQRLQALEQASGAWVANGQSD